MTSMKTIWHASDVAKIDREPIPEIVRLGSEHATPLLATIDLWDMWPICRRDGRIAEFDGVRVWMVLSAPKLAHPDLRHDVARIRLMTETATSWHDMGNLLPDGLAPGTREWAGSAVTDDDQHVTLYFTATGRHGEAPSCEQRIFATSSRLTIEGSHASFGGWTQPEELFQPDGDVYVDTRTTWGGPGLIKGFRDPGYFRDPRDGTEHILFVGSDGRSTTSHDGVVGLATRIDDVWTLREPIISGTGLCNEFERPHVLARDGSYYLFWSTQRHVFAPAGPSGPTGLYGMVADRLTGPYRPLNGTGLVAANPAAEPKQTYSWLVLDTLEVMSFVDLWGMSGRDGATDAAVARRQFGGTPAPVFRLVLDGAQTKIVHS